MASRFLTPYFQSNSWFAAKMRLFTCSLPCKIPITQKYGAEVLTGIKTGIFSSLNPGDWSKDYEVWFLSFCSKALIELFNWEAKMVPAVASKIGFLNFEFKE